MFTFKPVAIGILLALAALLAGEMHGLAFGAKEDSIKSYFKTKAENNKATLGEKGYVKAAEKAWKYLKRSHEHFMGLGAVAMALIIFIGLSPADPKHKMFVSTIVGLGAFMYPFSWLLISINTAGVGAHAAKESLALIAKPSAGLCFIGLLGTIWIAVKWKLSGDDA